MVGDIITKSAGPGTSNGYLCSKRKIVDIDKLDTSKLLGPAKRRRVIIFIYLEQPLVSERNTISNDPRL